MYRGELLAVRLPEPKSASHPLVLQVSANTGLVQMVPRPGLAQIADFREAQRLEVNKSSLFQSEIRIHFVKHGAQGRSNTPRA